MGNSLQIGLEHSFAYTLDSSKLVPSLYPEAEEFRIMPDVFATGFMVGLIEWTCIQLINKHIDWPEEQSVGIHIDVSHLAATPAGMTVTTKVTVVEVDGKRIVFEVDAHDGIDCISRGRHERFIINKTKFDLRTEKKRF